MSIKNILEWIDEWATKHPTFTSEDIEIFAKDLNEQVSGLVFNDPKNRAALGYGGKIGEHNTGVWETVNEISNNSNDFGYISDTEAGKALSHDSELYKKFWGDILIATLISVSIKLSATIFLMNLKTEYIFYKVI